MTLPGAPVARMLNTCSIGRRWKSREGWSRPVLTGERGTLFPTRLLGRVSSCGGFSLDGKECCFLWSRDERSKRFARVRCPVPGPPRSESWLVPLPAAGSSGWPLYWFCGGHGPGETPGPFPNPEAKAWHGDGTALERVWESSTPRETNTGRKTKKGVPGASRSTGTPTLNAAACYSPTPCRVQYHRRARP